MLLPALQMLQRAQEQHSCSHISWTTLQSPWRIGATHLNIQKGDSACAQTEIFRGLRLASAPLVTTCTVKRCQPAGLI